MRRPDLKDRAADGIAARGGTARLGDLAAELLQGPDTPLARRALRALLAPDSRFAIAGDDVELVVQECPLAAVPIAELTFAVLDFETNGYSPGDRAIELGLSLWRCGEEVGSYETLLDPGTPVAPFVTRLTGIREADLEGRPAFEDVLPEIAPLLEGAVVVAHNLPFDRRILLDELDRAGGDLGLAAPAICTLRLARRLLPKEDPKNLDALAERFGLTFTARHRALGDAQVTGRLLHVLLGMAAERAELDTLEDLQTFLSGNAPERQEPEPPQERTEDYAQNPGL